MSLSNFARRCRDYVSNSMNSANAAIGDTTKDSTVVHQDVSELNHISLQDAHAQDQSPLFQLPGEVRDRIYSYALAAYEDTNRPYERNTYWYRPQYSASRKNDATLLRCCKRIYAECWFIPFSLQDHSFWLTHPARAPSGAMSRVALDRTLDLVHSRHGDIEIEHVRFFAQLYMLEDGHELSCYLDLAHFHPRYITVTLRHTDWWFWEDDEVLRINGEWVRGCRFPASLRQFKMELETLERKKVQVDSIVKQMKETWYFTRKDGVKLFATTTDVETSRWKGSSIWEGDRWVRDEIDSEPETLSYYVATVTWQYEPEAVIDDVIRPCDLEDDGNHVQSSRNPCRLTVSDLDAAQVPPGTPASVAIARVFEYRAIQQSRRRSRRLRLAVSGDGI